MGRLLRTPPLTRPSPCRRHPLPHRSCAAAQRALACSSRPRARPAPAAPRVGYGCASHARASARTLCGGSPARRGRAETGAFRTVVRSFGGGGEAKRRRDGKRARATGCKRA
eukprot:4777603-Prymnesium_polylepis.1